MKWLYTDRFKGHLSHLDPRGPLTGAGGCVWPTIPAYRYRLQTTNAYGSLSVLNTWPILIEQVTPAPGHDDMQYLMIGGPPPITFCIVWKRVAADRQSYDWEIGISAAGCGIMEKTVTRSRRKCNEDFPIGEMACPSYYGGTGTNFQAKQVEWDKTAPPTPPIPP